MRRVAPETRGGEPFLPAERLSLDQALAAFTIGSAVFNGAFSPRKGALLSQLRDVYGAQTAETLGDALSMTSMGARRHLDALSKSGLVDSFDRIEGVGRPRKFWRLSRQGHEQFPDAHADLAVKVIGDVRRVFTSRHHQLARIARR